MSLYLKYRPNDFENLVGQDFINSTLKKAIANEKTVGAYLFCGPRGTGKTTTARLFAKSINCENSKDGKPCLECRICIDFNHEKLIDIIEIDAASHTGVDNIREIIERAQFTPSLCKYKVYIIDEVHMLSKGAFNALLKILEEPPSHVKFILATTETHKVPDTIISRCQRYDFKRIEEDIIKSRLKHIAVIEEITIDNDSLEYIAKSSSGGLRNAISLFEQLIDGSEINYKSVVDKLGIVSSSLLENFLEKLINSDKSLIDDYQEIIDSGKNVKLFFKELIFFSRDKILGELKSGNEVSRLIHVIDTLDATYSKTKNSMDENTTFLVGVLKLVSSYREEAIETDGINSKQSDKKPIDKVYKAKNDNTLTETKDIDVEDEISADDLNDLFDSGDEKKSEKQDFDNNLFITELKKSGAKGGLTMALRGSTILLEDNKLTIKAPTSIAKNQVSSEESNSLMQSALVKMGLNDINISVS